MRYVSIPGLEKPVSNLAIGSMIFSPERLPLTFELLDAFVERGGTIIDTAYVYAGGNSERALGVWLRERDARERVVIIDKGCHPRGNSGPRVDPEAMRADLAENLERLGTPYIDLYMLHRDDESLPVGPIVEALNEEVARGRIRSLGASNWRPRRIEEANEYAAARGLRGFVAVSNNLSLARAKEPMWAGCVYTSEEDLPWYVEHQFPLISWSSQAGGFFTGRYSPEDTGNEDMVRVYYSEENWERLARARELAERKGVHPLQIALAWVLSQPFPTVAIIGPQTPEELESSVAAADMKLTPEEMAFLDLQPAAV
jgi:aryl-alcohol dehydrogenase-like predicted oxidoreductase